MAPPEAKCSQPDTWKALGASGLDVCQVAQDLITKTCPSAGIHELDLDNDLWYTVRKLPPEALKCGCTHVMYNLLTACAGCQKWDTVEAAKSSAQWPSIHDFYSGKCGEHPQPESNTTHTKRDPAWSTTPPAWASIVETQTFNLTQALEEADGDSQAQSSSPLAAPATATETPTTSTPTAVAAPETSSSGSGPNIGAIVGGVIGGLAFLAALIGLCFWLHRRRRRARDVAPSAEFIKPEYYATPPLLSAGHDRRDSDYHDDIEEAEPSTANRQSWAGGLITNRMQEEDDDGDMLPPFTRGAYIGPSPHEKGHPERRDTADSDMTMRTNTTTTHLLPSPSAVRRSGPSDHLS